MQSCDSIIFIRGFKNKQPCSSVTPATTQHKRHKRSSGTSQGAKVHILKLLIMCERMEFIKSQLEMSLELIRMYDWLLDMFVLDFFVDNHWEKLPDSWRDSFENLNPQELGCIMSGKPSTHVFPLSFLALIRTVKALTIPRQSCLKTAALSCEGVSIDRCGSHPRLKNLFLKHVKLKKRHEISSMADVVNDTASECACSAVVDFGSGLGHLVRMLSYKYELYAAGIEGQTQLTEEARKLDLELEYTASKHLSPEAMSKLRRPIHFNKTLTHLGQLSELPLPETMDSYGLIGLHPCGDLGPLLLKHFVSNGQVKFICLVGCCFMKLTGDGYPMSEFVKGLDSHLSYVSREISCHAIDTYCERLVAGKYEDLKVHAYRAALESVLVTMDPKLKHAPIRSIKHTDSMPFKSYCSLALEKLDIVLPTSPEVWSHGEMLLSHWRRVVTVYTLRLTLAPLVETVILLDRELFALEKGMSCEIRPVFDPKLSPRNHIMTARR